MEELESGAQSCEACVLSQSRNQVVWGSGPIDAKVLFVGEAPGRKEDLGGEPFIGAAGKVLDTFLQAAELARSEIYIANVVKCRPPENRDPKPEEIAACEKYLQGQIRLLNPAVIVSLGKFSTQTLLQSKVGIAELQGHPQELKLKGGEEAQEGIRTLLPLYHPAASIYDPKKREPFLAAATTLKSLLAHASLEDRVEG
jgi:DNA polymerase